MKVFDGDFFDSFVPTGLDEEGRQESSDRKRS